MSDDPIPNHLRERNWRGKLTDAEDSTLRVWLAANPEGQQDWELETGLTEALERLPDAPLASNFTARVIKAVELDEVAQARRARRQQITWWRRLALRLGAASIVGAAGFFAYRPIHQAHVRTEVRQSVLDVSAVASLPGKEELESFDAIWLSDTPAADEKLLTLLQ